LNRNLVARENPDEIHPELAGNMRQYDMASANINIEHRVGQGLDDRALKLDYIVFSQV
jgi:hypothetical protein